MPSNFSLSVTLENKIARVRCAGRFDAGGCDKLEDAVDLCLSGTPRALVIDISSAGVTPTCLQVIAAAESKCRSRDVRLSLRLSERQRRALGLIPVAAEVPVLGAAPLAAAV